MLGRMVAAVAIVAGITSAALAQDVALPEIDFGRYHALVIGNNDYQHLPKLATAVGDGDAATWQPWPSQTRSTPRRATFQQPRMFRIGIGTNWNFLLPSRTQG